MANSELFIKILVDNRVNGQLCQEHGFAIWIETAGRKLLFDTGQGQALVPNAAALGCDLRELDALILSHGHYDHCGSISALLEINPQLQVYAHAGLLAERFGIRPGEAARNISVPLSEKQSLQMLPESRMHWINNHEEILDSVGVTGTVERRHPLEDTGGAFYLDHARRIPDPILDDMSIWFRVGNGLVIITGCCHSGLINTVGHIRQISGVERIRAILGGLHLNSASGERLQATCAFLRELNPEIVVPCHCTGDDAVAFLTAELGGMIMPGSAGMELVIG